MEICFYFSKNRGSYGGATKSHHKQAQLHETFSKYHPVDPSYKLYNKVKADDIKVKLVLNGPHINNEIF